MTAKPEKITAVLWDFGGVFTGSPFAGALRYAQSLGVDSNVLREIVFGSYDKDTDHPWHRLERGEQSMEETSKQLDEVAKNSNIAGFTLDGFFGSMRNDMNDPNSDRTIVVEMVRRLKAAGIRNAIITNNIREFTEAWRKMIPVDELFEEVIDSSYEGMRKPDPAIYHLALERLGGVPTAEAVFLDDAKGNVKAASDLGIYAILVEDDPMSALEELSEITGIAVPQS